ncbi:MAG: hypothetical protein NVS3B23_06460 [Candidatus Saccharimonadales bacterium]
MEKEIGVNEGQNMNEAVKDDMTVVRFTDGLGFGSGGISHNERKTHLDEKTIQAVEAMINSPAILVALDVDKQGSPVDDDGCGDGRGTKRIFEGLDQRYRSLHRSKVFGGGSAMGVAAAIANGESTGKDLNTSFHESIENLKSKHIGFGAHTDEHSQEKPHDCGCGAIDKAPLVVQNVVQYRNEIRATLRALGIESVYEEEVLNTFQSYAQEITNQPYSGQLVADEIISNGKIVKELAADHREMYIILNTVPGMTVNQNSIRTISDDQVQTFAVDLWRVKELAEKMYPLDVAKQEKAYLGEVIYTLSAAATLTTGDLPVYIVS